MTTFKRFLTLFLCATLAVSAWAVPAKPGWQTKTQPDGTPVSVQLMGDEFCHYWVTKDGKIAKQQEDGTFVVTDEDIPTDAQIAKRRQASKRYVKRSKKVGAGYMPTRALFILVSFSNQTFKSTSETYYKSKLGDSSEGAMSMYNYLKLQSNGLYTPPVDVYGPYTLSNTYATYGANDSSGDDVNPAQMIVDACKAADNDIDFSLYDGNNDGKVDNVYVLYAGKGEADGGADATIWPHQWDIYYGDLSLTLDGKSIRNYACSAELNGSGKCAMGTPLHEYGHVIGLPDYYDTKYSSTNYTESRTPGEWSIMDQGSYNNDGNTPPNYSIFDKYYLGWATPKFLSTADKKNVTMTTGWDDAYQITGGTSLVSATATSPATIYYIENRQKSGWDAYLPGHGMVIWQVKYNASAWNNNNLNNTGGSPRYTLLSASGNPKDIGKTSDPYPGSSSVKSCTPVIGCAMTEITESGNNITFKFNGGVNKTKATYEFIAENCTTPADGEVAINAALNVHITPSSGYTLDDASCWTVEMGGVELTYGSGFTYNASTNTFSIASLTDDVVIMVEAKLIRTVTWSVNGVTTPVNFVDGAALVLPSTPSDCSGTGGKKFVGWTANSSVSGSAPSDLFTTAGSKTVTANTTYYAVYATASGSGGGTFDGNTEGSYKIYADVSGTKYYATGTGSKISSTTNAAEATEYEFAKVTGGWSIKTGDNFITYSSSTNLGTNTSGYTWILSAGSYGTWRITAGTSSSRAWIYRAETTNKFGGYSTSNVNGTEYFDLEIGGGSGTSYSDYSLICSAPEPCTNQVNLTKGSSSHGTFSLDKANDSYDNCSVGGLVVTVSGITPEEGYEFGEITQTGIVSGVTIDQAGKTVTYAKDVAGTSTINVTFTPKPTYAVRFFNNGEQVGVTQNLYEGQTAVKPSDPSACEGYTFVGWWTATLATDNTTAETWVTDFTVTGAQDYYAVYSHTEGGGGSSSGTKTFSFSSIAAVEGWANGVAYTEVEDSPVTITAEGGGNNGKWYTSGSGSWRIYSGGTVIITVTGGEVTSVSSSPACTFTIADGEASYSPSARTDYTSITVNYTVSGGGTTYYTTTAECVECTNKVTLTKGTSLNGTFALDKADGEYENCAVGGLVVHVTDITPSEDYQFKEITQAGIATGVKIDNNAKTVTYDKDVAGTSTINVVFEHKPTYTIRFYNGESLIGSTQTVTKDKTPSVPANPTACDGYTFVGWWTSSLPANNTESHAWVSDFTATGNQDYYAVYRHNEGGSGSGTESIIFSDVYAANTVVEGTSITIGTHTSVTFTKGGSDTQYYTNGSAIRWYGGGTCVVASDAGNITGITFTFGSSDGNNMIEADGYEEPTWTGEASSVTFAQSGSSSHRRIAGISVTIDGGGTAHYTSVFSCSGHTITVAEVEHGSGVSDKSRCDEGGTVTITLTADEGYDCGGITTSPVVATTQKAECTYTFSMPDADITVTPTFTPKTPRTFTFEKGTGICATNTLTEAVWNGGVTLPTATANSGCDPEYVFAGWATSAVTIETEVRPTLYAAGTLYNGEETTLYAVYSQTTGGSASGFTLSYTIDDVTYYVAARTGTNKYMGATTDMANAARFTIVTSNDKQYLCWHGENDTYVSNNSNKTDLLFTTNIENAYSWDITETGNTIALVASSGRHFMFNTNIDQRDRFAAYSNDTLWIFPIMPTEVH